MTSFFARRMAWSLVAVAIAMAPAGCRRAERHPGEGPSAAASAPSARAEPPHALLPNDTGPYYPSLARTKDGARVDVTLLGDTDGCGSCHTEAAKQWRSSAHAHASFDNPWYRAVVDEVRASVGNKASRHCGGCHDPLLLFSGQMDADIAPDNKMANGGGVTCLLCHGIVETRADGNASYTLATDPVPIPRDGDPESIARHKARVAMNPLKTPALCATCHRGFLGRHTGLDHHLPGIEEPGPWRASPYAGARANLLDEVGKRNCIDCHMPKEPAPQGDPAAYDGRLSSHRFAGAHTPIAALLKDDRQLEALARQLESSIQVDVPVAFQNGQMRLTSEPIALRAGDRMVFDVVIRNTGVGHNFPGGVKDMQDTWVEVTLTDVAGRILGRAGTSHADHEDPSAYALRTLVVDSNGTPETRHFVNRFGTVAFDHTVAPLAARIVRYAITLPNDVTPPLAFEARVRHRRHRMEAREMACEATLSERGKAFVAFTRASGSLPLDSCAKEPILDIGAFTTSLGGGGPTERERPIWSRLYAHALGLSTDVEERLGDARASINRALEELNRAPGEDARTRASLLALLGRIAARQGRLDEALASADRAQALIGAHPAFDRVRADAYMQVWRWPQAAAALSSVTEKAPGDTGAWRDLARAWMSAGNATASLDAAKSGLKLQPRDEGLLRCEALSLEALGSSEAPAARAAFLFYREADETTASRLACGQNVANCERDRQPVVTIDLETSAVRLRSKRTGRR